MQRIKTIRWPIRNPFGDRLFFKARFVIGDTLTIPAAGSFVAKTFMFNSFPDVAAIFGDCPGLNQVGASYLNYRIRGITLRFTIWAKSADPLVFFTNAISEGTAFPATPSISTTPEQRWSKYRVCTIPGSGARPTQFSVYYSVNKVTGPDAVVRNDSVYVGSVNSGSPSGWTAPASGPTMQYGLFTMNGLAQQAGQGSTIVKIEATVHTQFYGKAQTLI